MTDLLRQFISGSLMNDPVIVEAVLRQDLPYTLYSWEEISWFLHLIRKVITVFKSKLIYSSNGVFFNPSDEITRVLTF